MFGRSCFGLLAISLLGRPAVLCGQSDRVNLAPDFSLTIPREAHLPDRGPAEPGPASTLRRWPGAPRTFGFSQIAGVAGTIFSGTVTAVARRPAARGQSLETVAITFHVEKAIRGVIPGEDLTISQWAGLWSSGQRYRIGEHVLLFLYPASKLGLTSCVGGTMGRFNVDPLGRVLLSAQHLLAFRADPVLGGKSRVSVGDFALAVRRASGEE